MATTLGVLVGIGLLATATAAAWITWAGNRVELRAVDCIIVPGARVLAPGQPGPVLRARVTNAIDLYRQGWARAIIFTGGAGESGPVESAEARRLALEGGLPQEHLFTESASHTTVENFVYARRIMAEHGWRSCLVSTDPFHAPRCLRIARDLGLDPYPAPAFQSPGYTRPLTRLYYTLRECAGWGRYTLQRLGGTSPD